MKTASIICTVILFGLLSLILSQTKRDGFVILLDESYRAEIVPVNQNELVDLQFPAGQPYENISNHELRRFVEREENFKPDLTFQTSEAIYLTDNRRGKLSRFSSQEGLKTIAVFGGKLKNLQNIAVDQYGNIYVSVQSDSKHQNSYLVKLIKF